MLAFTGASQVDIVGHSLGVTLAREWMRQDDAGRSVRRLVAIDGPNHGIINCSPLAANYWQLPSLGGFTPDSEVCHELGSPDTPFLQLLNGRGGHEETAGPTRVLVIRNADTSFVFFPLQDGVLTPVPAVSSCPPRPLSNCKKGVSGEPSSWQTSLLGVKPPSDGSCQ